MEAFDCMATAGEHDVAWTSKGDEQIAVECKLLDGPMAGQSLTWYGGMGDDIAGEHTRKEWTEIDLKKMGWDGADLIDCVGLGTKTFRVHVEPDNYNGKSSMKIKRIFASGGLAVKNRLSDDEKQRLRQKLKGARNSQAQPEEDPFK